MVRQAVSPGSDRETRRHNSDLLASFGVLLGLLSVLYRPDDLRA
jgi:hypothetical protein